METLTISLDDVLLYGRHGVMTQEREVGNEFRVSVAVTMPAPAGCATDKLEGTLSYADIYDVVSEQFSRPSALIEHVAHRISRALFDRWPLIDRVVVKVTKVTPPITGFAGSASVCLDVPRR